jgi:hypothetical protein
MVILAMSYKGGGGGRCIAGREVLDISTGGVDYGEWIRPIATDTDQGQLIPRHYNYQSGNSPSVLDLVQVPLGRKEYESGQPENWNLAPGVWTKMGAFTCDGVCANTDMQSIAFLEECPNDLWLQRGLPRIDCISEQFQKQSKSSLVMIKPTNFRVKMFWEWSNWDGHSNIKIKAYFTYNGQDYIFSLTDPEFRNKYCGNPPREGDWQKVNEVRPEYGDNCLLCISVGKLFEKTRLHYKLVATVIPCSDLMLK